MEKEKKTEKQKKLIVTNACPPPACALHEDMCGHRQEGTIVAISLPSDISSSKRARFFRDLYGYNDNSQYGKYHYRRKGILDKIGYVPFCRGVFIIPKTALPELKQFMKGKATITTRTVKLTAQDKKLLT